MRRSSRISDAVGHDVGVDAAADQPDRQLRAADPLDLRAALRQARAPGVQRGQDRGRRLQRVDAGRRHRGVRRAADHLDLQMQAAVMRVDDGVGKPGADRQVRPRDALPQQPGRPDLAAHLLVIGQMQLDACRPAARPLPPRPRAAPAAPRRRWQNQISRPPRRVRTSSHRRTAAPYGSCVQPSPGGTTSPCAFSAITGPSSPKRWRTTKLVALTMPQPRARPAGTAMALDRQTERLQQPPPHARRRRRSRRAGCRTASAPALRGSRVCASRCVARKARMAASLCAGMAFSPG